MTDRYGRKIDYMRISVTDRCNLRCVYCVPEEGVSCLEREKLLSDEEIVRIAEAAAQVGVSHLKVTGGEPLLRKHLSGLAERLSRIPGIDTVTLTTNGILLPDQIKELVEAGISGINISIDTLDEERYRNLTRGGKLSEALAGLRAAVPYTDENVTVKVNAVLYEKTWREDAKALSDLAKEKKVHVRFIEHMPLGAQDGERPVLEEEILSFLEAIYGKGTPYTGKIGEGPGRYYTFPGLTGKIGFISAMSHKFCESCNRIRLTSDGTLRMCLQSKEGIPLRELLRNGSTKEELTELLQQSINKKPRAHQMEERKIEAEGMCQIGG